MRFSGYGDRSTRTDWSGADGTYSIRLPDGRELWLFADTILGPVNPDRTRPSDASWVHNSFVVQSGRRMSTVYTRATPPAAVLTPPGRDSDRQWYWPGAATVADGALNVVFHLIHRTGSGGFDFAFEKNVLARFSTTDLHLLGTADIPSAVPHLERGSWILRDGGYTYIYGVEDLSARKYLHIARTRGTGLRGAWEYFTRHGWSRSETDSTRALEGVGNAFSVTRLGPVFMLVTQDTTVPFSSRIVAYFSCSPAGPFVDEQTVYRMTETGPTGSYRNRNVYAYNAHVHPELSRRGRVVVSYDVNSLDVGDVMRDVSIYRPRFVALTVD